MSCSTGNSDGSNKSTDDKTTISESENSSTGESTEIVSNEDNTEKISENVEGTVTIEQPVKEEETLPDDNEIADENMSQKVKDYILLGQVERPAAEQLKWNARFLEEVDIDSLYNEYVANGGNAVDVEAVAKYVTENAPIPSNWQEMFKKENLPNLLTLARIILIPIFLLLTSLASSNVMHIAAAVVLPLLALQIV